MLTSSKIVDRSFVQIVAKYERLLQVDLRHQELCNLKASSSHYQEIENYFSSLMEYAPVNVLELSLQSQCSTVSLRWPFARFAMIGEPLTVDEECAQGFET